MIGFVLMAFGMFASTKATLSSVSKIFTNLDYHLNNKNVFLNELTLMGSTLKLNQRVHRDIAQNFFNTCRLGKSVEQVENIRFIRMYLFTNTLLYGDAVDNLPVYYLSKYPEFRESFLDETRKIWSLNHHTLLPFVEVLKHSKCKGFILPSESELFATE